MYNERQRMKYRIIFFKCKKISPYVVNLELLKRKTILTLSSFFRCHVIFLFYYPYSGTDFCQIKQNFSKKDLSRNTRILVFPLFYWQRIPILGLIRKDCENESLLDFSPEIPSAC